MLSLWVKIDNKNPELIELPVDSNGESLSFLYPSQRFILGNNIINFKCSLADQGLSSEVVLHNIPCNRVISVFNTNCDIEEIIMDRDINNIDDFRKWYIDIKRDYVYLGNIPYLKNMLLEKYSYCNIVNFKSNNTVLSCMCGICIPH